jgi:hypothetical protein
MTDSERPKEEREAQSHGTAVPSLLITVAATPADRTKFTLFARIGHDMVLNRRPRSRSVAGAASTERE